MEDQGELIRGAAAAGIPIERIDRADISVVGLGYVGAVSVACLASLGHRVVGVDVDARKVAAIAAGEAPLEEARLADLLMDGVANGRIAATADFGAAVRRSDVTMLSVGTPTAADGGCDTRFVAQASRAIGTALAMKETFHAVVLRCSVPPGTTLGLVASEIEKASGKVLGRDFGVAFNPEFLREGVAVADFFAPSKTVVGASDARTLAMVRGIFAPIDANVLVTSIAVAEMIKYVDNVWHATKVVFGNEVGRLCKGLGIDSHEVIDVFLKDEKLNLSPYYLRPGFAFGGSCLPKEVRAVDHLARTHAVALPLISSLIGSNETHVDHAMRLLAPHRGQRIGLLGLAFKSGTDDLRESPILDLMARLAAEGFEVAAFDPCIRPDADLERKLAAARYARPAITGFLKQLPGRLADSAEALVADADVLVVGHATPEFRRVVGRRLQHIRVLDLVRLFREVPDEGTYEGICW